MVLIGFGVATGDKFLCRSVLLAFVGATWAANPVHSLCNLLLDGSAFRKK